MRRILLTAALASLALQSAHAQGEWFVPQLEESLARHLADRTKDLDGRPSDEEEAVAAARRGVRSLAATVESWGVDGVVARAPELARLDFPHTSDRIIAAIATYGACSVTLHPELAASPEELSYVTFGEISVAILSAYLQSGFVARGGSSEQLAAYLRSKEMERFANDIQVDEELREYVNGECGPVFGALMDDSRRR